MRTAETAGNFGLGLSRRGVDRLCVIRSDLEESHNTRGTGGRVRSGRSMESTDRLSRSRALPNHGLVEYCAKPRVLR